MATPQSIQRYHVFLASPGDVSEQRKFVRAFFSDYNIQQGVTRGIEFVVVDWENHASIGVGDPQKIITRETLVKYRDSLVLVIGILGQRFGTPTSTHESGTEEEFERALGFWKEHQEPELKWFFLEPPEVRFPPDPNAMRVAVEQWSKVKAFQERLKNGRPDQGEPAVWSATFQDLTSFQERFRRDLNLWLGAAERPWNAPAAAATKPRSTTRSPHPRKPSAGPGGGKPASASVFLGGYLDRLREETGRIALLGLGQSLQAELDILEAYVPLKTAPARRLVADERELGRRPGDPTFAGEDEPPVAINQVFVKAREFAVRGVVLLGDPGSGKTTAARQLVYGLASGRIAPEDLGLPSGVAPLLLRFRNLEAKDAAAAFDPFLERELAPVYATDPARRRVVREAILEHPRLLWVFDGLDEVVEEGLRCEARDWIQRLLKDRHADSFLVTSRFQGYRAKAELGGRFAEFHVQPLEPEQSKSFVRQWYREVGVALKGRNDRALAEADERAQSLVGLLDGPAFRVGRMPELPTNPLLLTILCVVHHQDRNLPRRRADLYARCVRVLLEHWRLEVWKRQGVKPFDAVSAERVLAELAWQMHQEQGRTSLAVGELAAAAEPTLLKMPEDAGLGRDGARFLCRMREQSGVMAMVGGGRCSFLHLTFQEYLAALHAEARGLADDLGGRFGQTWWREPILLAMALGRPEFFSAFLERVLTAGTWRNDPDLFAQCLDEARNPEWAPLARVLEAAETSPEDRLRLLRVIASRDAPALGEVAERLAERETGELRTLAMQIAARAKGGAASTGTLGVIGVATPSAEPSGVGMARFDAQTGLEFVWIPPGEFRMGGQHALDGKPVHSVRLTRGFWLGRYTVTNKDYRRFVEATGHASPASWSRREFSAEGQPVVSVSWEEAMAYCEWARCRLPTEAEWEFACRAGSSGAYCFGDDKDQLSDFGWYDQNSEGSAQPVGQKLPNDWGLYDMHGNVWEWCQDRHGEYPSAPVVDPTGRENGSLRVLRGGSWYDPARHCRSAFRSRFYPAIRSSGIGFRVVLARSFVPGPSGKGGKGR